MVGTLKRLIRISTIIILLVSFLIGAVYLCYPSTPTTLFGGRFILIYTPYNKWQCVQNNTIAGLYYDIDTGVEYYYERHISLQSDNVCFTPLLEPDGTPIVYPLFQRPTYFPLDDLDN